jgi:tetratricopeptide (TPR) repeat protein
VGVNRLEDEDLRQVLDDLLGPHELPVPFRDELITQSLGNPGLLRNLLELAQQAGALSWDEHRWVLVAGHPSPPKAQDDLMRQIFLGRLQRLTPAAATLVRLLAVAEQSLPTDSLGRLLGLQGDALEDAIQGALGSRLMLVQQGQARIPDTTWRDLVLGHTSPSELKRLARALVAVLQEQGASCSLALRALASDEDTALANTLASLDLAPPGPPASVSRLVGQALELKPTPLEAARLYEHLADAWTLGSAEGPPSGPPPAQRALEALQQATHLLGRVSRAETDLLIEARLFRKQAQILLRLRHPAEAHEALMAAAERLADHPLHPEQPRLRLALGQLHLLLGHHTKGIRALEEGLQVHGGTKPLPQDQAPIMLALGQAMGAQSQFQRASSLLQSAQRMLEHGQDFRSLVPVQIALGQVRLAQGQTETCVALLQEALQTARMQGDLALQAQGHLALGVVRSLQQFLGPALSHLDRSLVRAQRIGASSLLALIQIWRARTLAALGDPIAADHAQFQALALQQGLQTPEEVGDHLVLQGEVARFRSAWKDAARLYKAASDHFESTGLLWRQRLAQLRYAQAVARDALHTHHEAPEQGWAILENLKGPVEGSGSRWLDLEWQRAHALLLSTVPATEPVVQEALHAWSEVQTAAREIQFPAQVLEANTEGALLLLQQGERLGARARIQDAFPSFQQLWTRLPDSHESGFMGREDLHRFRQTVEAVGLRFILPERADPLLDWTPTQMNLPAFPDPG